MMRYKHFRGLVIEVMKFTPYGPDITLESTLSRIAHTIEHQQQYGFAKWIIIDRNTMKPFGDSGHKENYEST